MTDQEFKELEDKIHNMMIELDQLQWEYSHETGMPYVVGQRRIYISNQSLEPDHSSPPDVCPICGQADCVDCGRFLEFGQ